MYQICTNFSSSVSWNIYSCPFHIWSQDTLFRRGWDKFPTGEKNGILMITEVILVVIDNKQQYAQQWQWLWWRLVIVMKEDDYGGDENTSSPPSQWVSGYFRLCFHLESSPWSFYLIFPKTWTDQSIQKFTFQKYKTLATFSQQFRYKEHRMGGQAKLCLSI